MQHLRRLSAGVALALAGCAVAPAPEYPADHPANPAAASAPDANPDALSTYRNFQAPPPAPASKDESDHEHHHH